MKNLKMLLILRLICLLLPCVMIQAKGRACGLLSATEYRIILKVTLKGTYDVPVAERTLLERSTLRRHQRYRDFYSVKNNRLYYKGKEVMYNSKCNRVIIESYHKSKGIGARRLYQLLKRNYAGVSELKIKHVLSKLPEYQKKNAKFPNKAPLKHVCSSSVHDTLQIDLVDMQREAVIYKNEKCKFILSVMDIFSRFVWLRAIPSKSADVIAKQLSLIFAEFGKPKIIQHDRGREFDGQVKRLLRDFDIKNIKSRPYHPQSQGKVERMHKTLKQKIAYDLAHANPCGINWAKQLPEYQRILNNDPKECLAWSTPYEIYYGRDPYNEGSSFNHKLKAKKLRDAAKAATIKCNKRNDKAYEKACKTPVYSIGETVLLRYKKKGLLNRRTWVVNGIIQQRSLNTNMYKIKYCVPDSVGTGQQRSEAKWYHISDITQYAAASVSNRKQLHRKKYYIPVTKSSQLENLRSEFGLPITMNPIGDGNCQFAAVSYQLRQYGILRSEETLRQEVVNFLRQHPSLGNSTMDVHWWNSVLEQPQLYLSRMSREYEYGDQITLQAMSQLYNVQIIVVSTINSATTLVSPDGSSILSNNIPSIILGHYPEGSGEHYVALGYDKYILETIIDRSTQITWETRNSTTDMDSNTVDMDSHTYDMDSHTYDIDSHTYDMDSHTYDIDSHTYDMDSHTNDLDSRTNDMDSNTVDMDSHTYDIDSHTYDMDSHSYDIDSHTYDMDSHTNDLDSQTNDLDSRTNDLDSRTNDMDSHTNDAHSRTNNMDSHTNNMDSHTNNMDSHTNDMDSHTYDMDSHTYDMDSHTYDMDSHTNDLGSQTNDLDSRTNDLDSRTNDMDSHTNDWDSRTKDMDSHTNTNHVHSCTKDIDSHTNDMDSRTNDMDSRTYVMDTSDSGLSEFQSRLKPLREMIHLKRKPKQVHQKHHVELPPEIWYIVVNLVLKQNPSSRFTLQRVNRLFKTIVSKTPPLRLYLNPDRFRDISVSPISVRRIIRIAGSGSGLVQAIRNVITHSSWANAWLFLRLATFCGWYTIDGIWYRRPRH